MVNYRIVYENDVRSVVEIGTNQIIKSGMQEADAKMLCRHLNFGGGFDGATPAFFLARTAKFDELVE